MIELKNVSKWFGTFPVLAECSTRVDKGDVVVICGPSGSGKSTLIKAVNGLEPFQKGEIRVDGNEIAEARWFGPGDDWPERITPVSVSQLLVDAHRPPA